MLDCWASTANQTCARRERDLHAFAEEASYKVSDLWKETPSGAKRDRVERRKVLTLVQARSIAVIPVAELPSEARPYWSTLRRTHHLARKCDHSFPCHEYVGIIRDIPLEA